MMQMHLNVNCTHWKRMSKTSAISVRVTARVKAAAEKAAAADSRSVASLVEKILAEWLRERGFLAKLPDAGSIAAEDLNASNDE
jgi:hypothetical protein